MNKPTLVVPLDEAKSHLLARISLAEPLTKGIHSDAALEDRERQFRRWDEYNREYLSRIFSSVEYAERYAEPEFAYASTSDELGDYIRRYVRRVNERIERLQSVVEFLHLTTPKKENEMLLPHRVRIIKADGSVSGEIPAVVSPTEIIIKDTTIDVDDGDTVTRQINNKEEKYFVHQCNNTGPIGSVGHIALKVQRYTGEHPPAVTSRPQGIVQHFNAPVTGIQIGNNNTSNVTVGSPLSDVARLIASLRAAVEHDVRPEDIVDVRDLLEAVAGEADKPVVKKAVVGPLLNALAPYVQGASANLLADLVKSLMG